jgi:hypothetical protein
MNTLLISRDIYTALTGSEDLNRIVDKRVFPIVAEEGTQYPFLTYNRTSITSYRTKCGIYEDTVNFSVNILTTDYLSGLDIGNLVRKSIEKHLNPSLRDLEYRDIQLVGGTEQFTNEGYVQTLNFQVIVDKKIK